LTLSKVYGGIDLRALRFDVIGDPLLLFNRWDGKKGILD
jgi:hypothetical protein